MASGNFTLFSKNKDDIRINDLALATVKMALISSAWTPDSSVTGNSVWADISANEVSGNGWTAGGETLASLAATAASGIAEAAGAAAGVTEGTAAIGAEGAAPAVTTTC